jgi:hypothetical protein
MNCKYSPDWDKASLHGLAAKTGTHIKSRNSGHFKINNSRYIIL